MQQVEVERAYRIIGALEQTARSFADKAVPALQDLLRRWRKRTLIAEGFVLGTLITTFIALTWSDWQGFSYQATGWQWLTETPLSTTITGLGLGAGWLSLHLYIRRLTAKTVLGQARRQSQQHNLDLVTAFQANIRPWQRHLPPYAKRLASTAPTLSQHRTRTRRSFCSRPQ